MRTALELVKSACWEANIPAPSALVGETATATLQLFELFHATGKELLTSRVWDQLKRSHVIYLESGRSFYPLPGDFYSPLPCTHWDLSNQWQTIGPLSDGAFAYRAFGYVVSLNRRGFRVWGRDNNPNSGGGQIQIDPPPEDVSQGQALRFEYISSSWLQPPAWEASDSVTSGDYRNSAGIYYTAGSTATSGSRAPNVGSGVAQDGGVFWKYLSTAAWQGSTAYAAGAYVTNGGNLYVCTESGTSASSGGPTGTDADTDIEDGSVVWRYKTASAWAAFTEYAVGAHVTNSSNYYRAVQGNTSIATQKSGADGPIHTATTMSDGTITWTEYTSAYDRLLDDSDLVLFDEPLVIAGLKWRFMRARGLEYRDLRAEYEQLRESAAGRWNPGIKISLADEGALLAGYAPNLREGDFTF